MTIDDFNTQVKSALKKIRRESEINLSTYVNSLTGPQQGQILYLAKPNKIDYFILEKAFGYCVMASIARPQSQQDIPDWISRIGVLMDLRTTIRPEVINGEQDNYASIRAMTQGGNSEKYSRLITIMDHLCDTVNDSLIVRTKKRESVPNRHDVLSYSLKDYLAARF